MTAVELPDTAFSYSCLTNDDESHGFCFICFNFKDVNLLIIVWQCRTHCSVFELSIKSTMKVSSSAAVYVGVNISEADLH